MRRRCAGGEAEAEVAGEGESATGGRGSKRASEQGGGRGGSTAVAYGTRALRRMVASDQFVRT